MDEILKDLANKEYDSGFVTDVEQEYVPKGLNEDIIRLISAKKGEPQWLLDFRLDAFRRWQKMTPPHWGHLRLPEIDFQDIIYYAAPKRDEDRPTEIDPALMETFDKLGIPLHEREVLAGVKLKGEVAVDAVFDSVSVATTFRKTLAEKGIIFCSFSEAVREDWSPTVRPPRLGGNERMGVFATRSPFRPNRIGLTVVRLIRMEEENGRITLVVSGADLMDGTPIVDIKPYLPYVDSVPDAVGGFTETRARRISMTESACTACRMARWIFALSSRETR